MTGTELLLVGLALSTVGTVQAGQAASQSAKANARVANINANIARDRSRVQEARQRRLAAKQLGSIRAVSGASGVSLTDDVIESSVQEAELDALLIRHGGEIQKFGFDSSSALERAKGKNAQKSSFLKASSTLALGGTEIQKFRE